MPAPDPDHARSLDEFIVVLRHLKVRAGDPSITTLTKRVQELWRVAGRPRGEWPARATVGDCFRVGRRRPNAELLLGIVRVLVDDADVVARWEHALGRVLGDREAAGHVSVRGRLPDPVPEFTERADVPPWDEPVLAITGMAGVGKTALAVHLAHGVLSAEPGRAVLFADLRGVDPDGPPADPTAVVEAFLRLLGVPGDEVPRSREGRTALYRERAAAAKALVLLDNARDEAQVTPLLPGSPECRTLVTSRTGSPGLPGLELPVFTPAEAAVLLRRTAGASRVARDPEVAARIADLLGRLPLAVSVIGRHLRDHPDWTLADYLPPLTALALEGGVRAALALSYDGLPAAHARVLRLLARQPVPDLDVRAAASVADLDLDTTRDVLHGLVSAHLVQCPSPDRYTFHDLVRAYAVERSRLEDPPTRSREAVLRLADHYRHGAAVAMDLLHPYEKHRRPDVPPVAVPADVSTPEQARAWLDAEEANLLAVADHHERPRHTTDLATLLLRHLLDTGRGTTGQAFHQRALAATRLVGDRAGEGRALNHLGATSWRQGHFTEALDHYVRALAIARELDDRATEGRVLNNIGVIHERHGRLSPALEHYEQALALAYEVGDPASRSRTLTNIGNIHWGHGRHEEALAAHHEALEIARTLGDRANEGSALNNIANVLRRRGDFSGALAYFERSRAVAEEVGALDQVGHVMANMATAHLGLGDGATALDLVTRGLPLIRDAASRVNEGYALTVLGSVLHAVGRSAEAVRRHREAVAIAEQTGDTAVRLIASTGLAEALCAVGENTEGVAVFDTALRLAEEAGDRYQCARVHEGLGTASAAAGSEGLARYHHRRAAQLYRDLNLPDADRLGLGSEAAAPPGRGS